MITWSKAKPILSFYIFRPWRLLSSNSSAFILATVAVVVDRVLNIGSVSVKNIGLNEALFVRLPTLIGESTGPIIGVIYIIVLAFVVRALFITFIMKDFVLMFRDERKSPLTAVCALRFHHFGKLLLLQVTNYIIFGAMGIIIYIVARTLWVHGVVVSGVFIVVVFALLFPLFYGIATVFAMLAVIDMPMGRIFKRTLEITQSKDIMAFYAFFAFRAILDLSLLLFIPHTVNKYITDIATASLLTGALIALPLSLLRSSSMAFKIRLLRKDPQVAEHFRGFLQ